MIRLGLALGIVLGLMVGTIHSASAAMPGKLCFNEVPNCISGEFVVYWENNGGLARHGYPLSPAQNEIGNDGKSYLVQYFERSRFEYHPENAYPYNVLLGQLGREFAYGPHQVPEQYLRRATEIEYNGQPHQYYLQTGHNLNGLFNTYWNQMGGLASYGYPISEQFQMQLPDGKTYTVQYFERARMELHPENAYPYNVLLGQLGREEYLFKQGPPGDCVTPAGCKGD